MRTLAKVLCNVIYVIYVPGDEGIEGIEGMSGEVEPIEGKCPESVSARGI